MAIQTKKILDAKDLTWDREPTIQYVKSVKHTGLVCFDRWMRHFVIDCANEWAEQMHQTV